MENKKSNGYAVYEAVVESGAICTLRSLVFATGLSEKQIIPALGELRLAGWITADPDWSAICDSGYLVELFAVRRMRLKNALNIANRYLSHVQLRALREKLQWSQQKTADFLGITRSSYSMLEVGKRTITYEHILKLKEELKKCQYHVQ